LQLNYLVWILMLLKNTEIESFIDNYSTESARTVRRVSEVKSSIRDAANLWIDALATNRKVIFCGNGGSAAQAQHLAAELMGRFLVDRAPLPAMSLTVDTSALTAIGNDYGYENLFARQLRGIGASGDVLVAISTSGNSANIVAAMSVAREMNISTIGLTGATGGAMAPLSDVLIAVPDTRTNHVQEAHIVIGHMICAIVERDRCSPKA
jgi:D-sedoheptulose 7-phosphate isomerase